MNPARLVVLLRRRKTFRWLFLGMLFSRLGDAISLVAVSWLTLSVAGPRQLGLVLLIGGVPGALSSPVAGHLIDRVGLRFMLIVDNVGRGLVVLAVPVLIWTHTLHVFDLYAMAFFTALLGTNTEIGLEAVIPQLVADAELESANSLTSVIWDVAAWAGPATAGLLIQLAGVPAALLVDVASFAAMAVTALAMPVRLVGAATDGASRDEGDQGSRDQPGPEPDGGAVGRALIGFRLLWQLRAVAAMTGLTTCVLVATGVMEVTYPVYSRMALHVGPAGYGLLVSAAGLGSLAGTVMLTPLLARLRPGVAVGILLVFRGALLAPLAVLRLLPVACVSAAGSQAADGPFFPINRAVCQRLIPAEVRGRVLGARGAIGAAAFPAGAGLGGLALGAFGPVPVIAGLAVAHVPLAVAAFATPSLRRRAAASESPDQNRGQDQPVPGPEHVVPRSSPAEPGGSAVT